MAVLSGSWGGRILRLRVTCIVSSSRTQFQKWNYKKNKGFEFSLPSTVKKWVCVCVCTHVCIRVCISVNVCVCVLIKHSLCKGEWGLILQFIEWNCLGQAEVHFQLLQSWHDTNEMPWRYGLWTVSERATVKPFLGPHSFSLTTPSHHISCETGRPSLSAGAAPSSQLSTEWIAERRAGSVLEKISKTRRALPIAGILKKENAKFVFFLPHF